MASYLFINQYFWPDEAATAQLLGDLTEDLVAHGHRVSVLCGSGRYSCESRPLPGRSEHRGVVIERVRTTDWGRGNRWKRLGDMFSFLCASEWRLRQLDGFDAVISMSSPPMVAELGERFSRRRRIPLILWAQDVYPEIAERLGAIKNRWLLNRLRKKADDFYRASSCVVVPGNELKTEICSHGPWADKIRVIPNWADTSRIRAVPPGENSFRKEQGWEEERVLMYSGNLGLAHEWDAMIQLIRMISGEMGEKFRFVLVGDSHRHRKFACALGSDSQIQSSTLPFQRQERLGEVMGAADAHLVSQRREADGCVVPSKFYGAVASGRPVIFIGGPETEIGKCVQEGRLGVVLNRDRLEQGIPDAIRTLQWSQDEPGFWKRAGEWAECHASRKKWTGEFGKILAEATGKS